MNETKHLTWALGFVFIPIALSIRGLIKDALRLFGLGVDWLAWVVLICLSIGIVAMGYVLSKYRKSVKTLNLLILVILFYSLVSLAVVLSWERYAILARP